jgi:hypothetical protein
MGMQAARLHLLGARIACTPPPPARADCRAAASPRNAGILALFRRAQVTGDEVNEEMVLTALWLLKQWCDPMRTGALAAPPPPPAASHAAAPFPRPSHPHPPV